MLNADEAYDRMQEAAYLAGKAINITQTTAGHAMCYKMTSLYGIAHGHAAALCVKELWPWMLSHTDRCVDPRGEEYVKEVFSELAQLMGCNQPEDGAKQFKNIVDSLNLSMPIASEEEHMQLKTSVNLTRLKNNPIKLDAKSIDELYRRILGDAV